MAKNIVQGGINQPVNNLTVICSHPATPISGNPVRWNLICGIANVDEDANGLTVVVFDCIAEVSVKGIDQSGNSAVVHGDKLYYTDADTPPISKKNTGTFAGYAYGNALSAGAADTLTGNLVASAATTTIRVWFVKH